MAGSEFRPNPDQEAAVAHGAGPLRIVAGAGSGKTTTLVRRICRLIDDSICRPGELLMLTFTNKAVADMRAKVAAALPPGSEQPRIETYHAFALALVREFAVELGFPPDPALLTPGPVRLFLRRHFDRLSIESLDLTWLDGPVKSALEFFSWHRHEGTYLHHDDDLLARLPPDDPARPLLAELLAAHRAYRALLKEQGAVDYDDLIALAVEVLSGVPAVREAVEARYRYLLVDEYQDTDYLQSRLVKLLAGAHGNITIVGDPDQTIYSFRGAAVSNILEFHTEFAGTAEVAMVTNYRSTPAIVAVANAVIRHNARRKAVDLVAERAQGDLPRPLLAMAPDWPGEARWIAAEMLRLHADGTTWRQMAVLVRSNKHKLALYAALAEAGIPTVVVGGMVLFDDAETARFIAYLRALAAPDADDALAVALGLPRYGLTDADVAGLARQRERGERLIDTVARLAADAAGAPALAAFVAEFWPLYRVQHTDGAEAAIRGALALHQSAMGLQARLNADQLLPLAAGFFRQADLLADVEGQTPPLGLFCQYLAALRDVNEAPEGVAVSEEEDGVRLMTVHAAKGLEFPVVFLPRLTDRDFPPAARGGEKSLFPAAWYHDQEPVSREEEERRLFYVAVTRAQDRLYLSWAPSDPNRKKPVGPSPFLEDLGPYCDQLAIPGDGEAAATGGGGQVDLGHLLAPLASRAPAAPLPDPAVGTDSGEYRPALPAVLSFSHLSTYQLCPYRFYLQYLLRLPGRPAHAADVGVRIHAAIERHSRAAGVVEYATFAGWAAALALPVDEERTDEVDHLPGNEEEALRHYWESEYGRTPALAVEQEFYVTLGGTAIRGFIDRIHRRPDGTVEVVDFKTYAHLLTEAQVRESLQLPIYIKACREALGLKEVSSGALYFLKHDVTVRVSYTEAELIDRWQEAERLVAGARAGEFGPTPGSACGFCPYREVCPAAVPQ